MGHASLKIIKRIFEAFTKKHFLELIQKSYLYKSSCEHQKIMMRARKWYGIERAGFLSRFLSGWFMDFVFQAQNDLFNAQYQSIVDLGTAKIGVGELKVLCSTKDSNSSIVYLLGFSDNMTYFDLYTNFALPNSIAVDVGANLGIHSLVLSYCVGAGGKVFSFEPNLSVYERMQDILRENEISNVIMSGKGVGDSIGLKYFNLNEGDFNIGKACVSEKGERTIKMTTLDYELRDSQLPISLIKIDVEGYELKVLKGTIQTLRTHKPILVCEFNPNSYSFDELKRLIPYEACYFRIPVNYYDKIEIIQNQLKDHCDLLIVPYVRLTEADRSQLEKLFEKYVSN